MRQLAITDGWLNFKPPLPPSVVWARRWPLPFPFGNEDCRVTNFSRNALSFGLRAVGLGEGDELLMPAYNCGSEVAGVVSAGVRPRFWGGDQRLEPDPVELEGLRGPKTRGLYLIHHLGLASDAPRWRRWCDERDLLLIEDAAPGWPAALGGRPLGSWGDLSIFSPWKTFGLPDCGAVLCDPPASVPPPDPALPTRELVRDFLRWPLQRSSLALRTKGRSLTPPVAAEESDFGLYRPEYGVGKASMALLGRLVRPDVAPRRAANYDWLREQLGERVPTPFRRPAEEGCPFGIPIEIDDKVGLLNHLARRGIAGLDFWAVRHSALAKGEFPALDRMRQTIVILPVHQQLRRRDLGRIASAALDWPGGRGGG